MGGRGTKEECVDENWVVEEGMLGNFVFKVTENVFIMIKLCFLHMFSDVAIESQNSPSLN